MKILHEKDCIKLKMIVEMEKYKSEVKRVTRLKAIDKLHLVTLLSYIFLGIVLLLLSDVIFSFKY